MYIIYAIICKDTNVFSRYVGSTENLPRRIRGHRSQCKFTPDRVVYSTINSNGGFDNWDVVVLDSCDDAFTARLMERYYIDLLGADLNTVVPIRFEYEYKRYRKNYGKKQLECPFCGELSMRKNMARHQRSAKCCEAAEYAVLCGV